MLGDGGGRQAEQLADLADAQFPSRQRDNDPHPGCIGQRFRDPHEFSHALTILRYMAKCQVEVAAGVPGSPVASGKVVNRC